ncbi:MAG: CdaR family protein [Candidatus Aminicenantes bacterium]
MQIKNFMFKNLGLRFVALMAAVLVWAMISGRERSYSEKTMDINVEYFGIQEKIDVRSVRPDKVRIKVRATSQQLNKITTDDFKIRINLQDVSEGTHNYWTENYLQFPEGIEIITIQQKMIEVTVKEFITREVPTRVRYKGRMKPGIRLIDRRLVPEKVKIFGYKSQITNIQEVEATEWVNLSEISESTVIKIPLKKQAEILKFEDTDVVEVHITVENMNKENKGKNENKKVNK